MLLHSEASEKSWILFRATADDLAGAAERSCFFSSVVVKWRLSTDHHALQLTI